MKFPDSFTFISDEVSQDLPDLVRFVKEFKLPGIEVRSMFGRAFKDLTAADVAEIRRTAAGEGWKIFGCASPVFKCDIDDAPAVRAHVEQFKRSAGVARELGCDLVRVFTFLRRPPAENAALLPRAADHLQELRAAAVEAGVRIGLENEHSCIVGTAPELAAILALLPDREFGGIWDPCNVVFVPGTGAATEAFEKISGRLFHVHIKDAQRVTPKAGGLSAVAMPMGLGDIGWREHFAEVESSGYRGMFSLETHWRVEQIAEEELHLPAGYSFSRGGEEASRVCLHNTRMLLPAQ
jgi:sugar phosphate isomerase/epimerase